MHPAAEKHEMRAIDLNGFETSAQVLHSSECDDLLSKLTASAFRRSRAGARHLISTSFVLELARDTRLQAIASAALRCEAIPFRVTLFDKSHESNWSVGWHQDTALPLQTKFDAPGWGPWSVKAGILYAHAPAPCLTAGTFCC